MAPGKRSAAGQSEGAPSPKSQTKSGKLPVAQPTSFSKFVVILAMHLCKKIIIVDILFKVAVYVCGTTVISLVTDLLPPPETYFANKKNPLNVYLVKWGWGWTCSIVGAFVYLTSSTYCIGDKNRVMKSHMTRMAVATGWWYIATAFMDYIEHITGFCKTEKPTDFPTKRLCKASGHEWVSWDPSGHTFLLIYCLLVMAEESRVFSSWETIPSIIQNKDNRPSWSLAENDSNTLQILYDTYTPYIRIIVIVIALLQIVWEIMLLATVVYFHNMPSKLIGALLAVGGWFLTYRVWYKMDNALPCLPGSGKVKYL